MPSIPMSTLYAQIDPTTAKVIRKNHLVLRWIKQRNSVWTLQQKLCFLDTVLRGWICAPLYFLKRETDGVHTENLFDGAHKLESVCEFMKDDFPIEEIKDYSWASSPLQPYKGKKFSELPGDVQDKFHNYEFHVNFVPTEVQNDPDALRILWQRLNNAGTPLNGYELDIPIYGELHSLLEQQSENWMGTVVYSKDESKRGNLEEKLYTLLALSDPDWTIPSFSSQPVLSKKWKAKLGKSTSDIEESIKKNKHVFSERLTLLRKILSELETRNTFKNRDGNNHHMKQHHVPILIILGRLGFWFRTIQHFNIHAQAIASYLRELFHKNSDELMRSVNCTSRNAKFQAEIIKAIDSFLKPYVDKERRFFTREERNLKLIQQSGKCNSCKQEVSLNDSEADHIVPYSKGGKTVLDNCQVLHKHCHRDKN